MTDKNMEEKVERSWSETIEVTGSQLVDKVKELVAEGNVRRLIIRKLDNEALMGIPLLASVAVGPVYGHLCTGAHNLVCGRSTRFPVPPRNRSFTWRRNIRERGRD